MSTIEVFADVCCPFTHVGLRRVVRRRTDVGRDDVALVVRAWPLELVNGVPLDPDSIATHVAELRESVAPDLFVGFDRAKFPASSLPALELAAAAYATSTAVGERISLSLRTALFEEGRDLGDAGVLDAIAAEHGVQVQRPVARDAVLADWREGVRRGVRGSPEFFVEGHGYFCPALDITSYDGELTIAYDAAGFESFLAACFAS